MKDRDVGLMLRVTCRGTTSKTCQHDGETAKAAESAMTSLGKLPWDTVLGRWAEGERLVYAFDTYPGESRVMTVTACRIIEKSRWAVCELGEAPRETAERWIDSGKAKRK